MILQQKVCKPVAITGEERILQWRGEETAVLNHSQIYFSPHSSLALEGSARGIPRLNAKTFGKDQVIHSALRLELRVTLMGFEGNQLLFG